MDSNALIRFKQGHEAVVALLQQREVLIVANDENESYGQFSADEIKAQVLWRMKELLVQAASLLASFSERLENAGQELGQPKCLHLAILQTARESLEMIGDDFKGWQDILDEFYGHELGLEVANWPGSKEALEQEFFTATLIESVGKRRYKPPLCPACRGKQRVSGSPRDIRYLRCQDCGRTTTRVRQH